MYSVTDPAMDRASSQTLVQTKMSQALHEFLDQTGCADIWRFFYSIKRNCPTFHMFNLRPLGKIILVDYTAIVESHHASVTLDLVFSQNLTLHKTWKLHRVLFVDKQLCELISKAVDEFLLYIRLDSISQSTLWETLKAVIRGETTVYHTPYHIILFY